MDDIEHGVGVGNHLEGVTTTVRAPVDLRMLFGIHDVDRAHEMYGELEIDVEVSTLSVTRCAAPVTRDLQSVLSIVRVRFGP